jgi:hypothetical protein
MAPEQAMGKSDARSDLYSLGIVLYQMLTGRVPYSGSTPFEVMMKQANETLQPARSLNPSLPREVDGVLAMALAKDPNRRFQSAGSLLRAVQALGQPGHASQTNDDLRTRAAPGLVSPPASRSNPTWSPDLSTRSAGDNAPPFRQTGAGADYHSNPGRGVISPQSWNAAPSRPGRGSGERYSSYGSNQPPAGRGGRAYHTTPPYADETFAAARPPRRPTNPSGRLSSRPGTRPPPSAYPEWTPDNTPRRGNTWLLVIVALLIIGVLGAGGLLYVDLHTSGAAATTAATATPTANAPTTTVPAVPKKPSYAFMRGYQVFVSVHGAAPQQMTNIPGVGQPSPTFSDFTVTDYLLSPLLFSPDGRYLAALIALNDAPRDGPIAGNLYVIDTQTNAVATPNAPSSSKLITTYGGANSIAWVDAHTLLISGDLNNASILSYDASAGKTSVAFSPAGGAILVGSVVVRGHFAFYSELISKSGSTTNFNLVLHQYDLDAHSDKQLFILGEEDALEGPGPQPNGYAPFDIAPDGAHILWHGTQPGGSGDGIWYGRLDQSGLFQLFATVDLGPDSSNLLMQPTPLLSPDGKKALLTTSNAVYTINIDGSGIKTYAYVNAQAAWRPDSSGITISQLINSSPSAQVYKTFSCTLSTGACSAFQNNAGPFYWSPV